MVSGIHWGSRNIAPWIRGLLDSWVSVTGTASLQILVLKFRQRNGQTQAVTSTGPSVKYHEDRGGRCSDLRTQTWDSQRTEGAAAMALQRPVVTGQPHRESADI